MSAAREQELCDDLAAMRRQRDDLLDVLSDSNMLLVVGLWYPRLREKILFVLSSCQKEMDE